MLEFTDRLKLLLTKIINSFLENLRYLYMRVHNTKENH